MNYKSSHHKCFVEKFKGIENNTFENNTLVLLINDMCIYNQLYGFGVQGLCIFVLPLHE